MYFMSDPQALHVTRNVIPGKLDVDLHLHRVHIPLVGHCLGLAVMVLALALAMGGLTLHVRASRSCSLY